MGLKDFSARLRTTDCRIILEQGLKTRTGRCIRSSEPVPNIRASNYVIAPPAVRDSYDFHFVLTDGNNYRFEDDKTKSAAIAAFGHREGAENLGSIYASLWEACRPADIL